MGWASYIHLLKYAIKRAVNLTSVTDLFITLLNYYMQGQNCCWHQTHWEAEAAKNISWHSELYFFYEPNPKIHIDRKSANWLPLPMQNIGKKGDAYIVRIFSTHKHWSHHKRTLYSIMSYGKSKLLWIREHVSQLLCVFPTINYYPLGM